MASMNSKEAQASLIDPMNEPAPHEETGPGSHFGSTMPAKQPTTTATVAESPRTSLSSNNPFRDPGSPKASSASKTAGVRTSGRPISREGFPDYRAEAFGGHDSRPVKSQSPPAYDDAVAGASGTQGRRRGSSLSPRYPGDPSAKPLDMIRKDSRKARRSPHLNKRNMQGPDIIDRLDPALGGIAYHHEGPYDAAAFARNQKYDENSPVAALQTSNEEALKATPRENVKDSLDRHKPLDGVAVVPPGIPDQFGRTYDYKEGTDMMREGTDDAGYKRWPGKDYDEDDLHGQAEPGFSLDRALRTHKIDDDGIEMEDHAHLAKDYKNAKARGTLDERDPIAIAGDDRKYADLAYKNGGEQEDKDNQIHRSSGSIRHVGEGLKKRIGSLRHKKHDD
ncbi:hypothetical protein LTR62_007733 [Meristemomyces frigidus]|uniref:Pal1 cell morphology protein n=1 Tax=Meristemomyces frigidus TaxID=1508187 RepID=A0AAN7TBB4_9PEZI|nr:hypothetical protein LTR62_007733 [Meristemomyces frigidus]